MRLHRLGVEAVSTNNNSPACPLYLMEEVSPTTPEQQPHTIVRGYYNSLTGPILETHWQNCELLTYIQSKTATIDTLAFHIIEMILCALGILRVLGILYALGILCALGSSRASVPELQCLFITRTSPLTLAIFQIKSQLRLTHLRHIFHRIVLGIH